MQPEISPEVAEKLYFNCFPIFKEDSFKRMLLLVTFRTIEANPRITLNNLKWNLKNKYSFTEDDVMIAVSSLSLKSIFQCVSSYTVPAKGKRKETVLLSVKNDVLVNNWIKYTVALHPEFSNITTAAIVV